MNTIELIYRIKSDAYVLKSKDDNDSADIKEILHHAELYANRLESERMQLRAIDVIDVIDAIVNGDRREACDDKLHRIGAVIRVARRNDV